MNRFFTIIKLGIAIASVLVLTQCSKDPTPIDNSLGLPSATQSGANTFACAITGIGSVNVPAYSTFINDDNSNDPLAANSGNGVWINADTLTIVGVAQAGSYFRSIQFTIIGNLQQGSVYTIDSITTIGSASTYSTCNGIVLTPTVSIADSGAVQLTKFDRGNKIVSGTFACNFTFPRCDSTIYITLGRFDYKY